jgi:hypothetical protein
MSYNAAFSEDVEMPSIIEYVDRKNQRQFQINLMPYPATTTNETAHRRFTAHRPFTTPSRFTARHRFTAARRFTARCHLTAHNHFTARCRFGEPNFY